MDISELPPASTGESLLSGWLGDSEMAGRVRGFDWSQTPLGALQGWSESLRAAVGLCLRCPFQMAIYWGPELNCIYNDAERDILGNLHPIALGLPAAELLHDSWEVVGPQLDAVMRNGRATLAENQPLTFNRRGRLELGYFTYSYSPILDESEQVGGVMLVSQETTERVVAEARIGALRELAERTMDAANERRACELTAEALEGRPEFPFTLIYLFDPSRTRATLVASGGALLDRREVRASLELDQPLGAMAVVLDASGERPTGGFVDTREFVTGADRARPHRAFLALIRGGGSEPPCGLLVAGVDDERLFDDGCQTFVEMSALGVGRGVAAARARETERERELRALINDLRAAQRRVSVSRDAERRRMERDLHDGAQQRLVSLRIELGLLAETVAEDPERSRASLRRLRTEVEDVLVELRELAHGLYPSLLASDGLPAALTAAAQRVCIPVSVKASPLSRAPRSIESATYFSCLEALQNAAKHAGPGAQATVRLRIVDGGLEFRVRDDGAGFRPDAVRPGQGLINVRDRVESLGGQVEVTSVPGGGTTVRGQIPLP